MDSIFYITGAVFFVVSVFTVLICAFKWIDKIDFEREKKSLLEEKESLLEENKSLKSLVFKLGGKL